ncbi:MAG: hypothetical protein NUV70_01850 [Caldiserica bacterium]|nr:hypothetical protein [Caldisericota bacterium]
MATAHEENAMAERPGFEPGSRVYPGHSLSRRTAVSEKEAGF